MLSSSGELSATFPIAFGRYKLVERLAVGGMAELYLGEVGGDHGFAKKVVIKRILPHLAADPSFTTMFIAEAKITAKLSHPRIAQTHRLGREEGHLFIEMEYVDGLDVLAMLRECAHRRVRLPPEVSAYIIKEVLDGLDYAHRLTDDHGQPLGLVHRDVSPSNLFVTSSGVVTTNASAKCRVSTPAPLTEVTAWTFPSQPTTTAVAPPASAAATASGTTGCAAAPPETAR